MMRNIINELLKRHYSAQFPQINDFTNTRGPIIDFIIVALSRNILEELKYICTKFNDFCVSK